MSYRRSDAGGHAGRLSGELGDYYGSRAVWPDYDDIEPGAQFEEALTEALAQSDNLLAIIGPDWLTAEKEGRRRLDDPEDWVRREVAAGSFLGADICELDAPLPKDGTFACVVGEFPVQAGDHQSDFVVGGFGPRQGGPERWYDPAIPTSLEFGGARHSFVLVFDTPEGLRLDGRADGREIEIDEEGISGSLRLDCPEGSPFDGDPALEAYVIESFAADGSREDPCIHIPTAELEFFSDGNSDNAYHYFGAEDTTTTTTITAATTTTLSD